MSITKDILRNLSARVDKPEKVLKEEIDNSDNIQVYMNTWKNYNEYGADLEAYGIKDGWMTPEQGLEFCKKYAEDEPFINDVDNCPFEVSEYGNAVEDLENIIKFNNFEDKQALKNAMETNYYNDNDVNSYIEKLESGDCVWFPGVSDEESLGKAYVDMVGFEGISDRSRYFNSEGWKDSVRADEEVQYKEEHGYDDEEFEEHEGEFEDYLDTLADDMSEMYDGNSEEDFDYKALGRDLSMDGYTFTSDGCIMLF